MRLFAFALTSCLTAFAAAAALAADVMIVDWKGAETITAIDLPWENHTSKVSPGTHTFPLVEELSWIPDSAEFASDKSKEFVLAITSSAGSGPSSPHILRLDPRGSQSALTIQINGHDALRPQMRGILAFVQKDFLEGADAPDKTVRFDAMSRLAFRGILDGRPPTARWLVRDGETWWVSEATLSPQLNYNESEERELIDPQSVKWAEYDPTTEPLTEVSTDFQPHEFQQITAVGIFWDSYGVETVVGGTSFSRMAMDSFQVQAQVE